MEKTKTQEKRRKKKTIHEPISRYRTFKIAERTHTRTHVPTLNFIDQLGPRNLSNGPMDYLTQYHHQSSFGPTLHIAPLKTE